ncbi:MAG: pseudaminic acid biosynthesis-associated methylase [Steroidobacter sp.]
MSDRFKTEQESFWAGEFGTQYIERNQGAQLLASNIAFFSKALRSAPAPASCIEFGANIGMNLRALRALYPTQDQYAIEINPAAAAQLRSLLPPENVAQASILEHQPARRCELALIKGVLIHLNPEWLPQIYDKLYHATSRYLLVCEYYNPSPMELTYRGHSNRLFKRDFCGEILDRHPDLRLLDYGFVYRRDPSFPQDDITWFLMSKRGSEG